MEGPLSMRHQYTPVFRDLLTSRVWAMPAPHRSVWLWFQLMADPEGFVPADVAGVAIGARVELEDARAALTALEGVDPDSDPQDPTQGVVLLRVARGWQVIGFEQTRERAKAESHKARNRAYMRRVRAERSAANDESTLAPHEAQVCATASPHSPEVDAPKPIPKPTPPKTEEIPPTPHCDHKFVDSNRCGKCGVTVAELRAPQSGFPTTTHTLDGWEPSASLRDEARAAGVTDFDERIARLRLGPVGGTRGVIASELDNYIRSFFGTWRTWGETERAKATQRALAAPQRGFAPRPLTLEPTARHKAYADKHGLDLVAFVRSIHERGIVESLGLGRARELLEEDLARAARAKGKGAA